MSTLPKPRQEMWSIFSPEKDSLKLSPDALAILETVLLNCRVNKVPTTGEQFRKMQAELSQEQKEIALNNIFKSLMDTVMREVRIRNLILNKYGFCVASRDFFDPQTGEHEKIYLCDFLEDFINAYTIDSQPAKKRMSDQAEDLLEELQSSFQSQFEKKMKQQQNKEEMEQNNPSEQQIENQKSFMSFYNQNLSRVRTSQNGDFYSSGEKDSLKKSLNQSSNEENQNGKLQGLNQQNLSTDVKQNESGEKSLQNNFVPKNFAEDQVLRDPLGQHQMVKRQEMLMHSEQKVHSRRELNNQFMTPLGKRDRKFKTNDDYEYGSEIFRGLSTPKTNQNLFSRQENVENYDSDDANQQNSACRKKRGLKVLSLKVQKLVFMKKRTTYKDVANDLIKQLTNDREMMADFGCFSDSEAELEAGLEEDKKLLMQQKWEKNVRRRVYDALNVLYAAGVLEKQGKDVFCNADSIFTKMLQKEASEGRVFQEQKSKRQSKLELKQEIEEARRRVEMKKQKLGKDEAHFHGLKALIERNKKNQHHQTQEVIPFPFILLSTEDSKKNEVNLNFSKDRKKLDIAVKEPVQIFGDIDAVLELGLHRGSVI